MQTNSLLLFKHAGDGTQCSADSLEIYKRGSLSSDRPTLCVSFMSTPILLCFTVKKKKNIESRGKKQSTLIMRVFNLQEIVKLFSSNLTKTGQVGT